MRNPRTVRFTLGLILLAALNSVSLAANARDMHGRLGVGYNSQFATTRGAGGLPAISAKYGLTRDIAASAVVGISTSAPSSLVAAIKGYKNVFYETHLNFYFMGGAGLVNQNSTTGFELQAGMGAEFFLPALESLGFSVETGASVTTAGGFAVGTMGFSFLSAGIHFYF